MGKTMQDVAAQQAARIIWGSWQESRYIDALPAACRPDTSQAGYAAQAALASVGGEPVLGWKIAATSVAGQTHIRVPGPVAGRLFESRVHASGAKVPMRGNRMAVAEAEFAFTMAGNLPRRERPYTRDEVMAAVGDLHPAIELPDSRFVDFTVAGEAQLAADNACANEFVLGTAASRAAWLDADLSLHPTRLVVNGQEATTGTGADCLGDPRDALTWLANCQALGVDGLRVGDIITTGVCGAPTPIQAGDHLLVDLGEFGTVEATMEP